MINQPNRVICGDLLRVLRRISNENVNLCYLDPPFFTNRIFQSVEKTGKINSFSDKWNQNLDSYLDFMNEVLIECYRILKKSGSLYLHCDWHASHYLKIKLDEIFPQSVNCTS